MGKTILFGGSGLLGSTFLKCYPKIISVGRTKPMFGINNEHIHIDAISDLSVLDNMDIDNVVFLIGNSNHHALNNNPFSLAFSYNYTPLQLACNYFKDKNLKRLVCFTSVLLYGDKNKGRRVDEEDSLDGKFLNNYLSSKYLSEKLIATYTTIPSIIVRTSNIYGSTPLDRPDLVPTLVKDCITKDLPSVWSKLPIRDFIFADDMADAVMRLINETNFCGAINIGSGNSYSVGNLCDTLECFCNKKILDKGINVKGVSVFKTNISLLQKTLNGWNPKHTIVQGLEKTYNEMKTYLNGNN